MHTAPIRMRRLQDGEVEVDLNQWLPEGQAAWHSSQNDLIIRMLQREVGSIGSIYHRSNIKSHPDFDVLHIGIRSEQVADQAFTDEVLAAAEGIARNFARS